MFCLLLDNILEKLEDGWYENSVDQQSKIKTVQGRSARENKTRMTREVNYVAFYLAANEILENLGDEDAAHAVTSSL